ncbi:hypothetical protein NW762_007084 [Fusarium torreyae]|uniref:Uncharacterized protein n=1 Tax=Fusarium torreyae TaxID=1237075 RepID=A0A9W8VDL1_9HYPO|nr:hypothetical protein NW762_007084 [Fusarium torreyae]
MSTGPNNFLPAIIRAASVQNQQNRLLRLPTEILLEIIESEDSPGTYLIRWQDIKSVSLVSVRLHHIARKRFYSGRRFKVFRRALQEGNVDVMNACARYNAVPYAFTAWSIPYLDFKPRNKDDRSPTCSCGSQDQQHSLHYISDHLIVGLRHKWCSVENFVESVKWLLLRGFTVEHHLCNTVQWPITPLTPSSLRRQHYIPFALFYMLWSTTDRKHHRDICRVIRFLSDLGLMIPSIAWELKSGYMREAIFRGRSDKRLATYFPVSRTPGGIMQLAMRSCCPTFILRLLLEQLDRLEIPLKSCPSPHVNTRLSPYTTYYPKFETSVDDMLEVFFDEFFDPWSWKAKYTGEMGDIFAAKIALLDKHNSLTPDERELLHGILTGVRKVEAGIREKGYLDYNEDAVSVWYELCMSASDICKKGTLPVQPIGLRDERLDIRDHLQLPRGETLPLHIFTYSPIWRPDYQIARHRLCLMVFKTRSGQKLEPPKLPEEEFLSLEEEEPEQEWWDTPRKGWERVLASHGEAVYILQRQQHWIEADPRWGEKYGVRG